MSKSCIINPRTKSGDISPLFTQLKSFLGSRDKALYWYTRAKSEEFGKIFPSVKKDNNGEPLFEELLNKCGLKKVQEESVTLDKLNKEYKFEAPKNYAGIRDIQEQATSFNKNSSFKDDYYATIEEVQDKARLVIKPIRESSYNEKQRIAVNVGINKKLEKLLTSWNIGIGALSNLEEKLGMNGVTDFDVALNSAEGIKQVIRLAKGEKGQQALPEEFAHFATEAIGNIPLKERILRAISTPKILERILGDTYEDYRNLYNDNLDLMAIEALGKLTAQVLNDENVFIPNEALFGRYLTSLKNFFSQRNTDEIDAIINEVMNDVYELANNIVNNRYELKTSNIQHRAKLANLENRVERDQNLLKKVIDQELKRLKIYGTKEEFNIAQRALIEGLQERLDNHQAMDGIYDYITSSLSVLKNLTNRLAKIDTGELSTVEKFNTLRNIRNYVSSYSSIMQDISNEIHRSRREGDDRFRAKLKAALDANMDLIEELTSDFYDIAKDEFAKFIKPFVGEGLTITLGRYKGKTYTAKEMLESMDRDITVFDRWLDSMADSSDPMIQIYDQIVKQQKGLARLDTIELEKEIEKKTRELELNGVKDTSFMYERDEDGKLTGYFIQKTWWSKYHKAKQEFFESLNNKYGENPIGEDLTDKNNEISQWYKDNTVKDANGMRVPTSKYNNPAYDNLNKVQKDYHEFIMNTKKELDAVLPNPNINRAPQIRRDFIDRMRQQGNKAKYFWETMKDSLIKREDDVDMGNKSTVMDFEGNEVMSLPIYYTRPLQDMNDLSLDTASSMIAYAAMANDFNRMNEVIDTLEVGRLILAQRKVIQKEGQKNKLEKFDILGRQLNNLLTKQGDITYFMQKLETFMEMQVYGKQAKDEGSIGKVEISKAANLLNKLTSYSTTALSLLTGTANAMQNIVNSHVEAASGRYFNNSELLYADKEYGKALPEFLGQIGDRIKTNKLALFSELFNVSQDYKHHVRGIDFNKKNWATRLMGENALFFTTSAGDHYTQHRIAIALAKRMPMKLNGKDSNLWECLEVEYIDKNNPKLGARLVVNKNATKMDGSKFDKKDILLLSNKIRAVENRLYGIYNSEDKNAAQQLAIGRLALLYRNWMRPLYLNRFGRGKYDFDLGDYTEGFYMTMGRFMAQTYKDLRNTELDIVKNWKNLSDVEKANMKRGIAELATYWTLYAMIAMIHGFGDDDKKKPWALRLAAYSALRLKTDMGALLPSPTMIDEGTKLFISPFGALTTIKKLRRTIDLVNPVAIMEKDIYTKEVKSGMYKGYKEYQKILIDLLPFRRQIVNAFDPDQPAKWYK